MSSDDKQIIGLRERKKAKTMAAIQMHAMRLFREQGYKATTVEQIADAAEISPSTFFRYFSTKEDVVISDNYDPLLVRAFENQPAHLSPLQAIRGAMISEVADTPKEELAMARERNQLIMMVPELRAAMLNNLTQMMQLIAEMVAGRIGREPDDIGVRTFAGSIIGVNISVMIYCADHPEADFATVLDEALAKLENGLPL
ncbi:acyl-CoA-like ligand-binding transcription factor [Paenibacillus segetis]|uniref:TetR family transcriptional regulator n=2 Tax=Paenibacillus segetis TaxID=1325360 RepID=A0ABQ1YMF8_9BACL|nr:TetR family transcriptional regulator [Paenibacillus segetis]GGH31670.1 TetR family transcriptional regulator [Paenibacillus segetis]